MHRLHGFAIQRIGYDAEMASALLFERDRVGEVDDWSSVIDHVGRKSILWIDLDRSETDEMRRLCEMVELDSQTVSRLESDDGRPYFGDFKSYLHTTAFAPTNRDGDSEPARVDCLVAKQWVVTVRDGDLEVFDDFRKRITGSSGESVASTGLSFSLRCSHGCSRPILALSRRSSSLSRSSTSG